MMSYKVNNLRESEVTMSHARTPAGTCYRWNENEEQRSNMKRAVLLDTVPFLWVGGEDDEFGIRAQCWRSSPSWGRRLLGSCLRLRRRRQTSVTSPHSDDWQSEIRTTQQQQQQRSNYWGCSTQPAALYKRPNGYWTGWKPPSQK